MTAKATFISPFAQTNVALRSHAYFTSQNLHFMVGRGHLLSDPADPTKEWTDEFDPDAPENTKDYVRRAWDDLIYGRQVNPDNVLLAMPSRQGSGIPNGIDIMAQWLDREDDAERTFFPINPNAPFPGYGEGDSGIYGLNRIYVKEDGADRQVWLFLGLANEAAFDANEGNAHLLGATTDFEPTTSGMVVDNFPHFYNDGETNISVRQGFAWKYLYTLDSTTNPVPIAGPIENNFWFPLKAAAGTAAPNFEYLIGVRNIIITVTLPANFSPAEFRQNWIVVNPTGTLQGGNIQNDAADYDLYSGQVLYIENRSPEIKQTDQQESSLIAFTY